MRLFYCELLSDLFYSLFLVDKKGKAIEATLYNIACLSIAREKNVRTKGREMSLYPKEHEEEKIDRTLRLTN